MRQERGTTVETALKRVQRTSTSRQNEIDLVNILWQTTPNDDERRGARKDATKTKRASQDKRKTRPRVRFAPSNTPV
jgi:hypothetical protein